MKAIAVKKEQAAQASTTEQAAYDANELNQTFQLASQSEAAAIPGDTQNFTASEPDVPSEEYPEDVPSVASIVDLSNKGA